MTCRATKIGLDQCGVATPTDSGQFPGGRMVPPIVQSDSGGRSGEVDAVVVAGDGWLADGVLHVLDPSTTSRKGIEWVGSIVVSSYRTGSRRGHGRAVDPLLPMTTPASSGGLVDVVTSQQPVASA
jgi:hypothetical protein